MVAIVFHVKGQVLLNSHVQTLLPSPLRISDPFMLKRSDPSDAQLFWFAYYAEGDVSAKRISDGQVIAVIPVKVKGFHKIREQAALNALAEAGTEAGEILSKSLLEKENSKD